MLFSVDNNGSTLLVPEDDSTVARCRLMRDAGPALNSRTAVRWPLGRPLRRFSRWWETIEGGHFAPPIDRVGS